MPPAAGPDPRSPAGRTPPEVARPPRGAVAGRPGVALWGPLYAGVFVTLLVMYLPQPVLPQLAAEFELGPARAGLLMSAMVAAIALAALLLPPLSDRWGRRPFLLGGVLGLALATGAAAAAPSFEVLLLLRVLQGAMVPGVLAAAVAYFSEAVPPERLGSLLGGHIAATVAGGLVGRLLAGALTQLAGWRWSFAVGGALCLLAAWALTRLPAPAGFRARAHAADAYAGLARHLRDPVLLRCYAVGALLFFAFLGVFTYLPFRLARPPFELPALAVGLVYTVYAAGIVSSPLAGRLADRHGAARVLRAALALTLLAGAATLADAWWLLAPALLLLCFANFVAQATATALVAARAAHDRAGANALYLGAYYLGGSLGGFLPGAALDRFGWPGVLLLTSGALLLALGVTPGGRLLPDARGDPTEAPR